MHNGIVLHMVNYKTILDYVNYYFIGVFPSINKWHRFNCFMSILYYFIIPK
jgi:hypothetical protein